MVCAKDLPIMGLARGSEEMKLKPMLGSVKERETWGRGYRPSGLESRDSGLWIKTELNRAETPSNQTCLHPPHGGCRLHPAMLSPPWPAGLERPAGKRGRRDQRGW